jgi:outer membrane protein assembly factor BamA
VPATIPPAAELERRGATIGRILIYRQDIFDRDDPRENYGLYRLADNLHYQTRENTVRAQLLFAAGEPLSQQKFDETERILRSRRYLSEAWVVPVGYDEEHNTVDVAVTVRDVWTLNPTFEYGRSGGSNHGSIGLEEQNLFGRGSDLAVERSRDVDRTSTLLHYSDANLGRSWWQLLVEYADNSDGRVETLGLAKPFYALDSRNSYGLNVYNATSRVQRYSNGVVTDEIGEQLRQHQAYYGWSGGLVNGWTQRWFAGVRYEDAVFQPWPGGLPPLSLPPDRRFAYPWLGCQLVENQYAKTENVDRIGRTEDLYFGRTLYVELGYSTDAFGGRGRSLLSQLTAQDGWHLGGARDLFASAAFAGRLDQGTAQNLSATGALRFYDRLTPHQLFYALLTGTATHRLDEDKQVLLGGDTGLRGYPLRFQGGVSSALLTLEHRVFTDWFPLRLVRVGGAVFFDAGRTWGHDYAGAAPLGVLKDVGIGLRLGNVRSGLGSVLHVDLSYALDAPPGITRYQVTVQTQDKF